MKILGNLEIKQSNERGGSHSGRAATAAGERRWLAAAPSGGLLSAKWRRPPAVGPSRQTPDRIVR